jgi:hypothetical protein
MREISVVWIDESRAAIHRISDEQMKRIAFKNATRSAELFDQIYENVKLSPVVLIVGPDERRFDLKSFLISHDGNMNRKIVGCELMAALTDQETASMAIKYLTATQTS